MSKSKTPKRKYGGAFEEEGFQPDKQSIILSKKITADIHQVMEMEQIPNFSLMIRRICREWLAHRGPLAFSPSSGPRKTFTITPLPVLAQTLSLVAERLGLTVETLVIQIIRDGIDAKISLANTANHQAQETLEKAQRLLPPSKPESPSAS